MSQSKLQAPLVHLNGTSRERLLEALEDAYAAAGNLDDALRKAAPNGRDYYPLGPDAFRLADDQHRARHQKVADIRREIEDIVGQIDAQHT